ncbi:hypothetical protein TTRE_0000865501 [Trichuris trichiura]|uniref:Uncharacterized protein n=1 Tax=Trichuris trichiura TaxID=36087 RepID=A0A077ZNM8_TRITR|nr:hypothetical protein TTRE_0000865501 [Trichuris trichiura]
MRRTFAILLCWAIQAVIFALHLSDENYLNALTQTSFITKAEEEELAGRPIPGHAVSHFLKALYLDLGKPFFARKDLRTLTDEEYAERLLYPRYITKKEYEDILQNEELMVDSTVVMENREVPSGVLSKLLKSLGFKDLDLSRVHLDSVDCLYLLSSKYFMTSTEEEEARRTKTRLGQRVVLPDMDVEAHHVSLFLKKLEVGPIPFDIKRLSDMGYLALLASPDYTPVQISQSTKVLPDRYLPSAFVSVYLKKFKIPMAKSRLTNGADLTDYDYAALLTLPHYVTRSQFDEAIEKGYDVIDSTRVLDDRSLSSKALSKLLKDMMMSCTNELTIGDITDKVKENVSQREAKAWWLTVESMYKFFSHLPQNYELNGKTDDMQNIVVQFRPLLNAPTCLSKSKRVFAPDTMTSTNKVVKEAPNMAKRNFAGAPSQQLLNEAELPSDVGDYIFADRQSFDQFLSDRPYLFVQAGKYSYSMFDERTASLLVCLNNAVWRNGNSMPIASLVSVAAEELPTPNNVAELQSFLARHRRLFRVENGTVEVKCKIDGFRRVCELMDRLG